MNSDVASDAPPAAGGGGLAADASAIRHDEIRWRELAGSQRQDFLATGRVSRSSEVTSRAFEVARGDARP